MAIAQWHPAKTGARGRPRKYSEVSIETALLIRQVFRLPLRQTQDLMNSVTGVLKADIIIPDFSSMSMRSIRLPRHKLTKVLEPDSIVIVDSTGLKVYGKDEWHEEKHDVTDRRTWRKCTLRSMKTIKYWPATNHDGNGQPDLIAQINTPFDTFVADGTYDGEPVSHAALVDQQPEAKENRIWLAQLCRTCRAKMQARKLAAAKSGRMDKRGCS